MNNTLNIFFGDRVSNLNLTCENLTFAQLIEKFRTPERINIKHDEYLALSNKQRLKYKNGAYYTNCTFSPPIRSDINTQNVSLISLDIDDSDDANLINEIYLDLYLSEFNYIAYTTMSSTPAKKRWRIIVEADGEIPSELYPLCVNTIAQKLNLKCLTSESFVLSQAMFATRACVDSEFLFTSNLSGSFFSDTDIDRSLVHISKKSILKGAQGNNVSDLNFLSSLVPKLDIEVEVVENALHSIDPDVARNDWLLIAAALKHQYGDTEEGFQMFEGWSSRGTKYEGHADCKKMWDSLKQNPDKTPATIKSLIHIAKKYGWRDARAEKDYIDLIDIIGDCLDLDRLMSDIPAKISRVQLSPVARESVIQYLKKCITKISGNSISIAVLRKECAYKVDESKIQKSEEGFLTKIFDKVPKWSKNYVYIHATNEFYNTKSGDRKVPEVFDNCYSKYLLTKQDKLEDVHRPATRPRDFVLNAINIPQYSSYTYLPGEGKSVEVDGVNCYNTYIDRSPPRSKEKFDYVKEKIENHIRVLLSDEREQNILLDYLAFVVQNPGKKIKWTILLQGAQGCGKTLIGNLIGAALGPGTTWPVDNEQLESPFTSWAENKLFIVMEEVHVSGSNRFKIMGKLKPFLTNAVIPINRKNKPEYTVPNIANYLLLSNHRNAIALENTDRRYCILLSRIQTEEQVLSINQAHFDIMFDLIDKYPGTIREYFMTRQLNKKFNPNSRAPFTTHKKLMRDMSKTSLQLIVEEFINDSQEFLVTEKMISSKRLSDLVSCDFSVSKLKTSRRNISQTLVDIGYLKIEKRVRIDKDLHTLWVKCEDPAMINDDVYISQMIKTFRDDYIQNKEAE